MFNTILFWFLSAVAGVLVSIFDALGVPVWDFSYLTTDPGAFGPLINAACWAIDVPFLQTTLTLTVTSLIAYSVTVLFWRATGHGAATAASHDVLGSVVGGLKTLLKGMKGLI